MKHLLILLTFGLLMSSCAFRSIQQTKNLTYTSGITRPFLPKKQLNIFAPKKEGSYPVLIFFYGGSWQSGKKEIYGFFGRRLARRGLVVVIPDYPLAPDYQIWDMENAAVEAVAWTKYNIEKYGGDPDQIVVSGHSAGGHLASLITAKEAIWDSLAIENPIKGAILNDPAGLDMKYFLEQTRESGDGKKYYKAFTEDPEVWEKYSTLYFLEGQEPPMLIMEGERTYPGISLTIDRFMSKVDSLQAPVDLSFYKGKKHVPMMTQFFWTWSKGYDDVLGFIEDLN
ncbi:alpha/beta hydrolase [Algoriphagus namhaensis]